jgi:DNA-binding NarL/FixJ family response regulator
MDKHIFVMDDSAFALELTQSAMIETGLSVQCGRDLADLRRSDLSRIDLVLMDVDMPEAYGDDIASALIGDGLGAPVYLLSNLPAEQLARRASECGAAGFIEKRLGVDHVITTVLTVLGEHSDVRSFAPRVLLEDFLTLAEGRMRRIEGAIVRGEAGVAASELHTLSGEASLLGRGDIAHAADDARGVALGVVDEAPALVATACAETLSWLASAIASSWPRPHLTPLVRTRRGGPARLLLLDDSDFYRSTLMGILEAAGYEVVEARRLSEARHRLREGHYDVAILDAQLDDGHGGDLIPDLRAHTPSTRLVLLSSDEHPSSQADLVLSKRLDTDELLRRIGELADRAPA